MKLYITKTLTLKLSTITKDNSGFVPSYNGIFSRAKRLTFSSKSRGESNVEWALVHPESENNFDNKQVSETTLALTSLVVFIK